MPNPITIEATNRGKVRDMYDLGDRLLVVATDRISAYDYVLPDEIPEKGRVLNRLSVFWFDYLADTIENHLISTDIADLPEAFRPWEEWLDGRFMIVKRAKMYPAECIVRGYLTGSGLKSYQATGKVCGISLPEGLVNSSKLPEVLFTPSTKAELGEHDENISFEQMTQIVGDEVAADLRDLTVKIYRKAADFAKERGIIIADTKFEFGNYEGRIILADEVLTPDSSRFWPADSYKVGLEQPSFDKQFVRNWLTANWDRTGNPPHMPEDVIAQTSQRYITAYEMITGKKW